MASGDYSSDSDVFYRGNSSPRRAKKKGHSTVNDRVTHLATTLQDTNKNLKAVDRMLEDYQALGDIQGSAMNKLRDDVGRSPGKRREERGRRSSRDSQTSRSLRPSDLEDDYSRSRERRSRGPTSPHRDYDRLYSDRGQEGRRRDIPLRGSAAAVRFYDDLDGEDHMHDLHQSIRDLTSDQIRLEDDLNREIERRNRLEHETRKTREVAEANKKPDIDRVMTSVDKRLQSIQDELHAERLMLKKADKISGELKQLPSQKGQALEQQKAPPPPASNPSAEAEAEFRAKLAQTISDKTLVESEMEKLKRKLEQSESRCQTLINQGEELRKLLTRSDDEKNKYRTYYEQADNEIRERRKRTAAEDQERGLHQKEMRRMEDEMNGLRDQLAKSVTQVSEANELRKELDRSEKQRAQLSDHIEAMQKEVDDKEKHTAKIITQFHEVSEKYEISEQQKHQTLVQLEETMKRLRDTTKELEELNKELQDSQQESTESIRRNEEIKARAQETVRQWKIKCKKLERDLEKYKSNAEQAQSRSDQVIKDLEMTRSQSTTSVQQLEHIKREFAELLAIRAQQDEQVRLKDVQVNELKSIKMDLENDLRDCKMVIERLEQELHTFRERMHSANDEKEKAEDQLTSIQAARTLVENQVQQLQNDVRELSKSKAEMASHLSNTTRENHELKHGLKEIRRSELTARETVEGLQKRLKEEKEVHAKRVEAISAELNQYKGQESTRVIEITRKYKKERVEIEAELQALKLERNEERNNVRHFKRQMEKFKTEIDTLTQNLAQSQEDNTLLEKQYLYLREELITKSQLTEDGLTRARDVELELLDYKERLLRMEKEYQNILHNIGAQVDSVIEVAAFDSVETYKALSLSKGLNSQPKKLLAEVQSKLHWLKDQLRAQRQSEQLLKSSVRDVVMNNEKDRQFLIDELKRQNEVLEDLTSSQNRTDRVSRERDVDQHVESAVATNGFSSEDDDDRVELDDLTSTPKTKRIQRDQIHQRYARLQETVDSLRQQLSEHASSKSFSKDLLFKNGSSLKKTPNTTPKKVRISSPPEVSSPEPSLPSKKNNYTPPPLSLTDEEFKERFIPRSPHLSPNKLNIDSSII